MAHKKTLLGIILLGWSLISISYAQIRSGVITGEVKDATGAIVPAANVVLTNQETNVTNSTKTTDAGQFTFPYLQPDLYSVSVSVAGFIPYRQTGIRVETNQTVRVDVGLTVGAIESAVEVTASAVQLQVESSTLQNAMQAAAISALPNVAQNPMFYAMLQANVVPRVAAGSTTAVTAFGIGVDGRRSWSVFGVNGGRAFTNDIQLDGLAVMSSGYNEPTVVPNTEGLQEVRVISNNFTAEYGRGQAVLSMITKSGTNQYHGEVDYRLRNEALNANTNSNNANGIKRSPFKVNELGGAVGGPIVKNKLFFFASYHFVRFNNGVAWLLNVPTALERKGDFSRTFVRDQTGAAVAAQIFNPWSVTQLGPDLYQRVAYPGAVIPNPDPYAVKMFSNYPLPNRTPDDVFGTNNFGASSLRTIRRHSENSRIDYKRGAHSFYGSGGIMYGNVLTALPWGSKTFNPSGAVQTRDNNPYGQIGDTVVLSPTLVLDVRYGVNRTNAINIGGSQGTFTAADYDAFGVPQPVQAVMAIYGSAPDVLPGRVAGGAAPGAP